MRSALLLALTAVFVAASCDDGSFIIYRGQPVPPVLADHLILGPAEGPTPDYPGGAPVLINVSGNISFLRRPVGPAGVEDPVVTPAAFVLVQAVSAEDWRVVIRETTTDIDGDYSFTFTTTMDYYVRARAQSGAGMNIDRVIHPRTQSKVVHALCSQVQPRTQTTSVINLVAQRPWDHGGAFPILDTLRRLRESVAGLLPSLGPIDVFWSDGNYDEGRNTDLGFVAGTFTDAAGPFDRPTIYLLGGDYSGSFRYGEYGDRDEDDETVIAHEWASVVQLTLSRDNNFGGVHAGEELIPTAAYSEGVVTAIGCALLDTRVYRDTAYNDDNESEVRFEFDLESGLIPGSGTGYGSEFVTTRVVWDLLDGDPNGPDDFDADGVAIPMADFLASFTRLRTRPAPYEIAWLPALLQQLIDDNHLTAPQADTLMAPYGEAFPPPGGPEPFADILPGVPQNGALDAYATAQSNPVLGPAANGVFRLVLAGQTNVAFTLTATDAAYDARSHRLELSVHAMDREILALESGDDAVKAVSLDLPAGTYLVRVQHRPDGATQSKASGFTLSAQ